MSRNRAGAHWRAAEAAWDGDQCHGFEAVADALERLVETVHTGLGAVARKLALEMGLPSRWACPRGLRPSPAGSSPTSPPVRAVAAAAQVIRVVGIALSVEHGDLGLVDCSSVAEPPRYRPGRTARPRSRDGNLRQSAVTKWWVRRQSPCCAAFVGHNPRNSRNHATSQAGRRGRSQTPPDDRPRRRNPRSAAPFRALTRGFLRACASNRARSGHASDPRLRVSDRASRRPRRRRARR